MFQNRISIMGEEVLDNNRNITRPKENGTVINVSPASPRTPQNAFQVPLKPTLPPPNKKPDHERIFTVTKPMFSLLRIMGLLPVSRTSAGCYRITSGIAIYSITVFLVTLTYVVYIKWDRVQLKGSSEGKFEEAVIDYLFIVYLLPVTMSPIAWYESKTLANVYEEWSKFEGEYRRITGRRLPLYTGNVPLLITLATPVISCASMAVTHATMVHFRIEHVIPYCYINTIPYVVGGFWYLHCYVIGCVALALSEDFQRALRNVGPSTRVSDYRNLWMWLSRQTRGTGTGFSYAMTFLCLHLFLTITLTIYGLLSQMQAGFGLKDIGLAVTAICSTALLFFVCDEAHFATANVRVHFQKKLLLVELSWMNEDAQHEINMFLRATEMNPTDISLGGFFDVNRTLFKSLLATMVTYLVVLLQFQISLPEEVNTNVNPNGNMTVF